MRFVQSAARLDQLPDSRAELAVVGRSNVGKSSLINALGGSNKLAMVSKTPGRTRLLNQFEVEDGLTIVDCPGYGYAKASATLRQSWQHMAEEYLLEREPLVRILVLVDGEIGPTKLDVQLLDWLRSHDRPLAVVATKHDKVKSSARDKRKRELAAGCALAPNEVVWVSAAKGVGLDRLRGLILEWLHE
jgi:GTP-binding protein